MFIRHCIPILFNETIGLICDVDGVMCDGECSVSESRLLKDVFIFRLVKLSVKFLKERSVSP